MAIPSVDNFRNLQSQIAATLEQKFMGHPLETTMKEWRFEIAEVIATQMLTPETGETVVELLDAAIGLQATWTQRRIGRLQINLIP